MAVNVINKLFFGASTASAVRRSPLRFVNFAFAPLADTAPGFQAAQPYKSAFDEMDAGAQLSVFGARGTDVVVKERKLNPGDYGSWKRNSVLFVCAIDFPHAEKSRPC